MSIINLYTRLNNWIDSPGMHPVRRFWFLSICLNSLIYCLVIFPSNLPNFNLEIFCGLLLMGFFSPLTGILLYFMSLITYSWGFLTIPNYWSDEFSYSSKSLVLWLYLPLVICPLILRERQNKYIKHLLYIIPSLLSALFLYYTETSLAGAHR